MKTDLILSKKIVSFLTFQECEKMKGQRMIDSDSEDISIDEARGNSQASVTLEDLDLFK